MMLENNNKIIKIIYKIFTFLKCFFPSNILPPLGNTNLRENTLGLF